ncbi:ATP-binding protein [Streptomyces xanthochromogenes]|uniref:ATP-binding protein n=1 Tax=Streptomyces TaxID=1883 RepID=UPI00136EAA11|nr:ATP-binding protein [Streptomyces sp. SID1034]MYV90323.1 ATP-binding protein [Streptomyces sp. SID1034]
MTPIAPPSADVRTHDGRAFEVAFPPDTVRVAHMRRITRAFLRHQHIDEAVAEDAVLAVSELVSNGVQHGCGELGLRVRCLGHGVRVEVRDSNPAPAALRVASPDAESGRGLFLVSALAHDWGVSDNGLTTWCELRWTTC